MNFILQSIELENFMGFKHSVFNFSKDMTLIVGPNGSGKSALLEALALSFQLKERGNSVSSYIFRGEKKAKVVLKSLWLDKELTITSIFSNTGRKITRTIDYDGQQYENTVANNFLTDFFNERNLTIAFALQGNERFLTTSKSQNFKTLTDLLQVDFEKENMVVKAKLRELEKSRTVQLEQFHKNSGAVEFVKAKIAECEKSLEHFNQPPSKPEESYLKEIEEEIGELNAQKNLLLESEKRNKDTIIKYTSLKKTIDGDKNTLNSYKTKLASLIIKDIQDTATFKDQLDSLQKTSVELQKHKDEIYDKRGSVNATLRIELDRKSRLLAGICPVCRQPISDNVISDSDKELESLQKQLKEIEQDEAQNSQTYKELQTKIKELSSLITTTELENRDSIHAQESKQILERSILELGNKIKEEEITLSELEKDLPTEDNRSLLTEYQEKIKTLELQKQQYWDSVLKFNTFESELKGLKERLASFRQQESQLNVTYREVEAAVKELERQIDQYTHIQQAFLGIPKIFMNDIISRLERSMTLCAQSFGFDKITIDHDDKGLEFYLWQWKEDILLDIPYFMCSSFQKNLVNICLVQALSNLFTAPFLCIDELDANADIENTANMGPMMLKLLQKLPIVAVTHDQELATTLLQSPYSISIIELKALQNKSDKPSSEGTENEDIEYEESDE